ncbi:hypothetical protein PIB30_103374, partial [Stylosanthes scabra]|nr:hypothetical protein [Stylosanthes scabra]
MIRSLHLTVGIGGESVSDALGWESVFDAFLGEKKVQIQRNAQGGSGDLKKNGEIKDSNAQGGSVAPKCHCGVLSPRRFSPPSDQIVFSLLQPPPPCKLVSPSLIKGQPPSPLRVSACRSLPRYCAAIVCLGSLSPRPSVE